MRTYNNRWISDQALEHLSNCNGRILDLGGGLAPYHRAEAIVDIAPYDAERLTSNTWGRKRRLSLASSDPLDLYPQVRRPYGSEDGSRGENAESAEGATQQPNNEQLRSRWAPSDYVQLDATREKLPFDDNEFDVGLCSHMLEDVEEPLPALEELSRVSKKVVIISTSRLLEQTKGIDHPRYCGFKHHKWMLESEGDGVVFTRKSSVVEQQGCHIICPPGKILKRDVGTFFHAGLEGNARVRSFKDAAQERESLSSFVDRFQRRHELFEHDDYSHNIKYWYWRVRQFLFGVE